MKSQHRSALLALAARRGEKGFSSVLAEAIEEYLNEERTRVQRRKEVLSLAGSLSADEAKSLRRTATSLRENWR
jgi:metal-responsive CopG/Arc/MetJ family transcriptional regulator